MFRWLTHVEEQLVLDESEQSLNISWSAFNSSVLEKQTGMEVVPVLLPLFQESSKSIAKIKHRNDVIKTTVDKVNKDQTSVIVFNQPLQELAKQVQWNWKDIYGETQFVVMIGPLHTKKAPLKSLGDWLENSVWCSTLVEAEIASSGTVQSFLHASNVSRTRSAHQV